MIRSLSIHANMARQACQQLLQKANVQLQNVEVPPLPPGKTAIMLWKPEILQ